MSHQQPTTQPASERAIYTFEGVASISLRFALKPQYESAIKLYSMALGQVQPTAPESDPPSCSLIIGDNQELLLMLVAKPQTDCTIVYWTVGTEHEQLVRACADLVAQGYTLLEPWDVSPLGRRDKDNTERAVLKDPVGNRMGLIINPPVPIIGLRGEAMPTMMEFPIEPTHVVNPPTADGESK